jgi:hypothetical protein
MQFKQSVSHSQCIGFRMPNIIQISNENNFLYIVEKSIILATQQANNILNNCLEHRVVYTRGTPKWKCTTQTVHKKRSTNRHRPILFAQVM